MRTSIVSSEDPLESKPPSIHESPVWEQARRPQLPSAALLKAQKTFMKEVYLAPRAEPVHSVVFAAAHKDRIINQGRRRGMQFPYWVEVTAQQHYPDLCTSDHTSRANPHDKYTKTARAMREPEPESAPKRATHQRARPC